MNSGKAILSIFIISGVLLGCSSEKSGGLSKAYHNTTSHYNAYFYATERLKEIEDIVKSSNQNNFNNLLLVHPEFDTTLSSTFKTQTEDCIKKASIAIQMHQNSKWVDDSYIVIGLARFYDRDFVNAIETFKYVNTKSEDDNARHLALAHLIRTFTDYGEYSNAEAVVDYLKKEELQKSNQKIVLVNKAHLYQKTENYDKMVQSLVEVAPMLRKTEDRAKIYFIIGQIYQQLGFDAEAYNNYKLCVSSNPEYELYFYARLNMAQVAQLKNNNDLRSVRKHFKKLLTDKKNKEFKDKIYYEMAEFEAKQGNSDLAIEYYKLSAAASINNNRQKGMSYLKLGVTYYETMKNYEQARNYYDSTIQVLPTDFEDYEQIKERQEILDEFVEQLNIINTQDSLLTLASMDSVSLMMKLNEIADQIEANEQLEKEKENRKKRRQSFANTNPFDFNTTSSGSSWYFDNPALVSAGQNEFQKKWGTRPLEDHWRRSNKSISSGGPLQEELESEVLQNQVVNEGEAIKDNKALSMFRNLPFSDDQKSKALDQIEEAYYKLGNIYNFKLSEKSNAATSFTTLLNRFPETEYEPEVLYLLYLLMLEQDSVKSETYKSKLLEKYPYSTYTKLITNPEYTEDSNEATAKLKAIYEKAYKAYKKDSLKFAYELVDNALSSFPETSFSARLRLLKILIIGQTEDIGKYKYELGEFIKKNPDSDVTEYAVSLLEASDTFEKRLAKSKGINYVEDFDQIHYFSLIYDGTEGLTDEITGLIEKLNTDEFSGFGLTTSNLTYTDTQALILVTGFEGIESAIQYYSKFSRVRKEIEVLSNSKIYNFVITKDNFGIFYQNKGLEEYLTFFNKNYN